MNRLPNRLPFSPVVVALLSAFALALPQAQLQSIKVLPANDGPLVEIITSAPVVPALQKLDGPPRVVVDLPNTSLALGKKLIPVSSSGIKAIRIDRHEASVRVVVDLRKSLDYKSELTGNRITLHFYSADNASNEPVATPQTASAPPTPIAVSSGTGISMAGSRVQAGSSVTAGADAAILRLGRGGEVRVCPGTTLSVTPAQNGRDLMLGMSTGALEAHYSLQASADSVLTPDFRILLAGPGEFDYAISADLHGNTCVRALAGNTASVIVSELIGEGTYQVRPSEQVLFHSGRLSAADAAVPATCGCPAPPVSNAVAAIPTASNTPPALVPSANSPETAPLPASKPSDVHVVVDAPFVFRASDAAAPAPSVRETETLPNAYSARVAPLPDSVLEPAAPVQSAANGKTAGHGFLGKIKKFFGAIFR